MSDLPNAEYKRSDEERDDDGNQPRARRGARQKQHRRKEQIELFLHRNRPQMQQRLERCRQIEIADLAPEFEIGGEERRRDEALRVSFEIHREEKTPRGNARDGQHGEQRREDAADATLVEMTDRETAVCHLAMDDSGDQEAGDDEEDIDADEAAGNLPEAVMVEDDGEDSHGAQTVHIRAVAEFRVTRCARVFKNGHASPSIACADPDHPKTRQAAIRFRAESRMAIDNFGRPGYVCSVFVPYRIRVCQGVAGATGRALARRAQNRASFPVPPFRREPCRRTSQSRVPASTI